MVSIACAVLMGLGLYEEGVWHVNNFYVWATLLNNICVTVNSWALPIITYKDFSLLPRSLLQCSQRGASTIQTSLKIRLHQNDSLLLLLVTSISLPIIHIPRQSIILTIGTWLGIIPSYGGWSPPEVAVNIQVTYNSIPGNKRYLECFDMLRNVHFLYPSLNRISLRRLQSRSNESSSFDKRS
jgi:hypothetical protein